jgi:hypothetical protein
MRHTEESMKKWLAVVLLVLLVLTGAMWLKSFSSHVVLADTSSPMPPIPGSNGAAPPPSMR